MEAMEKNKSMRAVIWVILIGILAFVIYIGGQQNSPAPVNTNGTTGNSIDTSESVATDTTDLPNWGKYSNTKYDFEIALSSGYEGYTAQESSGTNGITWIDFVMNASGTAWPEPTFTPLRIGVVPLDWFEKNAIVQTDNHNLAWLKGKENQLDGYLGIYAGQNAKYAFVGGPYNQDCPGIPSESGATYDGSPLCRLAENAPNILKTFRTPVGGSEINGQ